jgi:hypothetical protein
LKQDPDAKVSTKITMRARRTHPGEPILSILGRGTHRPGDGASILILGSCQGDGFVADEVLIEAETLEVEAAICGWLRERGIHVTTAHGEALSTDGRQPG